VQVEILQEVTSQQIRNITRLIDPSLRRSTADWASLGVHRQVADMCEETWDLFDHLGNSDEAEAEKAQVELDDLRARYSDFYEMAEAVAQSSILAERRSRRGRGGTGRRGGGAALHPPPLPERLKRRARRELVGLRDKARARIGRLRSARSGS
jgi:hypothetical protein